MQSTNELCVMVSTNHIQTPICFLEHDNFTLMPITEGLIADGAPNHHITLKSNTTLTYDLFMLIVYVTPKHDIISYVVVCQFIVAVISF